MKVLIVILLFFVVALMRVAQKICGKISSNEIKTGKEFFAFGALNQGVAAVLAFITVLFVGFGGFNLGLTVCSVFMAVLFAVDLFSGMEALKGCSIAVVTMFGLGGLVISVVVSYFWFGEEIRIYQLIGLGIFFVSAYLLSGSDGENKKKMSAKTFLMLIANFLANGFVMVVQKYFALKVEGANSSLFSCFTFSLCCLFMLVCFFVVGRKSGNNGTNDTETDSVVREEKRSNKKVVVCGLILAVAVFLINIIITEMSKTVPSIIIFPVSSAISVIIATVVGYFGFKEKLSVKKTIGLIAGIVSVIIIGI